MFFEPEWERRIIIGLAVFGGLGVWNLGRVIKRQAEEINRAMKDIGYLYGEVDTLRGKCANLEAELKRLRGNITNKK